MSALLTGDPGSCSSLALTLQRTAGALRAEADRLTVAAAQARESLTGRQGTALRRRSDALADRCRAAAAALEAAGTDLQVHATDLAGALARARSLSEVAARHHLSLGTDGVSAQWGITGEADAAWANDRDRVAGAVEAEFSTVRVQVVRRRDALDAAMSRARDALATQARALRG